jgi:hypothetical protein
MFDTVLHVGGVTLVCQIAAIGMLRSRFGFERRPAEAAAFVAACLTVEVLGLLLVVRLDLSGFGPGKLGVWAAVLLRDATLLAILFAAARSALRGRTIVVACIAYTGLVSLVAALLAEQEAHSLRCAGVAALGGLAQAFFVLAARRVRSLTVVPADHPLRADWAVDLAQARRIPGPG